MIHERSFKIENTDLDQCGNIKPASVLYFAQEIAGSHAAQLGTGWDVLQEKGLFWAVIRTRAEIFGQPKGGVVVAKTWPMPATRAAYPRCVMGYDEDGSLLFKVLSLWVLMDVKTRAMVLPGKSGIGVPGVQLGDEPPMPRALPTKQTEPIQLRTVTTAQLDRNGHMNNTKYMDWVMEVSDFSTPVKGFELCYLNEGRLGDVMELSTEQSTDNLTVDIRREKTDVPGEKERIFAASVWF